jgi:myo-inositol-1(or 4)-monophosphatase
MAELVEVCESVARLGGDVLREWQGRVQVREKGRSDLLTEADLASQAAIQQRLAVIYPEHAFVGEESDCSEHRAAAAEGNGHVWIVDPLDGTTNYAHGFPHFAVSVAVARAGQVLAAAIYQPVSDECFTAERGSGAQLNGQTIRTSSVERLRDALVAASFPTVIERDSDEVAGILNVLEQAQSVRRTGSAALNLCYLASGRIDAYWATETKAWDVAAGWLIVEEANGIVTGLDGQPFDLRQPTPAVAATQALSRELISLLNRGGKS